MATGNNNGVIIT